MTWQIAWDPLWPFGPSQKDKRIAELEANLRDSEAVAVGLERARDRWEDARREGKAHNERLLADKLTLAARVEHQKAELQAVHTRLEKALEVAEEAVKLAGNTQAQLAEERRAFQSTTERILDAFVTLRRDGFNQADQVAAPSFSDAPAAEEPLDTGWLEVMDAVQDRAGGDPALHGRIIADAHRWRSKGIPVKEVVKRIYEGFE